MNGLWSYFNRYNYGLIYRNSRSDQKKKEKAHSIATASPTLSSVILELMGTLSVLIKSWNNANDGISASGMKLAAESKLP